MDPDKALEELRAAIEDMKSSMRNERQLGDVADEVIIKFEALDGWMSRGGFKPKAWSKHD